MLVTTQPVGVITSPTEYMMAALFGAPIESFEGRVIGPVNHVLGENDSYIVAVRSTDEGPFDTYIKVIDLEQAVPTVEGSRINVVGYQGPAQFEDAIIEAFIPEGLEFDE